MPRPANEQDANFPDVEKLPFSDAAFVRARRTVVAATQCISSNRSLTDADCIQTEIALSLQLEPTAQTRTACDLCAMKHLLVWTPTDRPSTGNKYPLQNGEWLDHSPK